MFLVRNERIKLAATYFSGLGIACGAIGGIGQVANAGAAGVNWTTAAWLTLSLALHSAGQGLLGGLRQ